MAMEHDIWITGVCAAIVAVNAMQRYDTPETNRLSTTPRLFFFSGTGYVVASLIAFAILSEIVLKPGVLEVLGVGEAAKLLARYTAPPVLAAVVLTTLLPKLPILKAADTILLERFQKLGRIPYGVSHLADQLTLSRLMLTQSDIDKSEDWIERQADVPNDLTERLAVSDSHSPEGLFTTLLVLHRGAESLEADAAYKPFFRKQATRWSEIQAAFHVFAAQSQAFFVLFDQLAPRAGTEASSEALKQARSRYLAIGKAVRTANTDFVARALTAVEPSSAAMTRRLRGLGFTTEEIVYPKLPVGPLVFMGVMLIVGLLAVACVRPPPSGTLPGPIVAIVIGMTQTIALLIAVLPKLSWAHFRSSAGRLPYFGWLTAATAAGLLSLIIDRGAFMLIYHNLDYAWPSTAAPLTPVAFMAAGLALIIGILCDLDLSFVRLRRLAEGVIAGLVMAFFIGLCLEMLQLPSSTRDIARDWWFPFALSFGLGFVPGFIAPELYRRARAEHKPIRTLLDATPATG